MVTKEKEEIAPVTTEAQAMKPGTEKPATLNQPAARNAPPKRFPLMPVIIAVLAVGLIVFAGLYFSRRGDLNIKVSAEEKRLGAETERQMQSGVIDNKQYRKIQEETQKILGNQPGAQPAAPSAPQTVTTEGLPPIKGKWTIGQLTMIYRETDSAKKKIAVDYNKDTDILIIQNKTNKTLKTTMTFRYNGKTESGPMVFEPNEINEEKGGQATGLWEFWFEITQ